MKGTRDKEEYRRASAIKQKLEGLPYRTIARNLDVNYRNVYNSCIYHENVHIYHEKNR
jgi:transposase